MHFALLSKKTVLLVLRRIAGEREKGGFRPSGCVNIGCIYNSNRGRTGWDGPVTQNNWLVESIEIIGDEGFIFCGSFP